MDKYTRGIENQIKSTLQLGKVAIIYGARQVGKTTLAKKIASQSYPDSEFRYLNCDEPDVVESLSGKNSVELASIIGQNKVLIIDEAQRVENIGITIKILHETFPDLKIIVTGSSSIDLANRIVEPLTGRSFEFQLYPLSIKEILGKQGRETLNRDLDNLLIFGSYPEVFSHDIGTKILLLNNISTNYLYKDIFKFQEIKNPDLVRNILQALAYQVGSEVSLNELATRFEVDKKTIKRYLELLEKAFIIYRLRPLARNRRNEVGKFSKYYFYDLGIRNSLIGNFNPLNVRDDIGALWENFSIIERLKLNQSKNIFPNYYFWRNYSGSEIDFIEEWGGVLNAFEFKYSPMKKANLPTPFATDYPNNSFKVINSMNFIDTLL